jgi:hypothetical protein
LIWKVDQQAGAIIAMNSFFYEVYATTIYNGSVDQKERYNKKKTIDTKPLKET